MALLQHLLRQLWFQIIYVEMDAVLVIKISINFCLRLVSFATYLKKIAVTYQWLVWLRFPKEEPWFWESFCSPVLKKYWQFYTNYIFNFFLSTLEKKIAKRIGNFYICSKKENTKTNASLPKIVSEQTDKMPPVCSVL